MSLIVEDNSNDDDSNDDFGPDHHFVLALEKLKRGLKTVGYSDDQICKREAKTNRNHFNHAFGASPMTLCTIYKDLQTTSIVVDNELVVQIAGNYSTLKWFLISLHFMRKYPTSHDEECVFNVSECHS